MTLIYNCKRCKQGRRVDYPLGSPGRAYRVNAAGKEFPAGVWIAACGGYRPTEYGGDVELGLCPQCGRAMSYAELKGVYSAVHKCDSRCMGARGPNCECSCGGANHGRSWSPDPALHPGGLKPADSLQPSLFSSVA